MKFGCNDFCVYCKYIGKEKTNMDDIEFSIAQKHYLENAKYMEA